ncbi:hypothetical protein C8R47DRAFT_1198653 [Mycena vitilis]|nr:hypothetical protein C8R47DRAFT_1198653 [Mycena vitilis]
MTRRQHGTTYQHRNNSALRKGRGVWNQCGISSHPELTPTGDTKNEGRTNSISAWVTRDIDQISISIGGALQGSMSGGLNVSDARASSSQRGSTSLKHFICLTRSNSTLPTYVPPRRCIAVPREAFRRCPFFKVFWPPAGTRRLDLQSAVCSSLLVLLGCRRGAAQRRRLRNSFLGLPASGVFVHGTRRLHLQSAVCSSPLVLSGCRGAPTSKFELWASRERGVAARFFERFWPPAGTRRLHLQFTACGCSILCGVAAQRRRSRAQGLWCKMSRKLKSDFLASRERAICTPLNPKNPPAAPR